MRGPLHRSLVGSIREIAEARGLTLSHIPDLAGLGRAHFWSVLGGRSSPTLVWVEKIAAGLGVEPIDLLAQGHGRRRAGQR